MLVLSKIIITVYLLFVKEIPELETLLGILGTKHNNDPFECKKIMTHIKSSLRSFPADYIKPTIPQAGVSY